MTLHCTHTQLTSDQGVCKRIACCIWQEPLAAFAQANILLETPNQNTSHEAQALSPGAWLSSPKSGPGEAPVRG